MKKFCSCVPWFVFLFASTSSHDGWEWFSEADHESASIAVVGLLLPHSMQAQPKLVVMTGLCECHSTLQTWWWGSLTTTTIKANSKSWTTFCLSKLNRFLFYFSYRHLFLLIFFHRMRERKKNFIVVSIFVPTWYLLDSLEDRFLTTSSLVQSHSFY